MDADEQTNTFTFAPFQVRGEIDTACADELRTALKAYAATSEGDVVCDCTELDFIDSSGLNVLVVMQLELLEHRRTLRLVNVDRVPLRVMEITGLIDYLHVNDSDVG